jgi:hypothetical protein
MDPAHRPLPLDSLVAESLEKLNEAESGLRHIILFAFDPALSHSLIEADAFIRRAILALKKALPIRE